MKSRLIFGGLFSLSLLANAFFLGVWAGGGQAGLRPHGPNTYGSRASGPDGHQDKHADHHAETRADLEGFNTRRIGHYLSDAARADLRAKLGAEKEAIKALTSQRRAAFDEAVVLLKAPEMDIEAFSVALQRYHDSDRAVKDLFSGIIWPVVADLSVAERVRISEGLFRLKKRQDTSPEHRPHPDQTAPPADGKTAPEQP